MTAKVSVSVVIPSFNQGLYIGSTLRSVFDQSELPDEVLVMDGGSTDDTLAICKHFAGQYADRFRYVSEPDRGQSHAINKGVAQTTGHVIGWLNSDDTYAPGAIAVARQFFSERSDVDLLYGNADFVGARDEFLAHCAHVEPFNARRLVRDSDFIVQPAAFFTRRAFEAVGGIDESFHYCMDYDLWLRIAARFKVQYTPTLLANFKWFGQNKTAVGAWDRLGEIQHAVEKAGGRGLPTYVKLEAALQGMVELFAALRTAKFGQSAKSLHRGLWPVAASPRAWAALLTPAVWRIIWTGQVLRRVK